MGRRNRYGNPGRHLRLQPPAWWRFGEGRGIFHRAELSAGRVDEDVFQRGLAEGDGADHAGEGFDELRDELVTAVALDAEGAFDFRRVDAEAVVNLGFQLG